MMMDKNFDWLEPWAVLCTEHSSFENELYNEIGKKHILYGKKIAAVGRRYDCDEVLFEVNDSKFSFAVVHLTYSKRREDNAQYPTTRIYKDLNDWINKCMLPDHLEYIVCEE